MIHDERQERGIVVKRLLCPLIGHRWVTADGRRLPGVNWYVGGSLTCERCGKQR